MAISNQCHSSKTVTACVYFIRNGSIASDFAYSNPFLLHVVCRLSHSYTLFTPVNGFTYQLAGILAESSDTLC